MYKSTYSERASLIPQYRRDIAGTNLPVIFPWESLCSSCYFVNSYKRPLIFGFPGISFVF